MAGLASLGLVGAPASAARFLLDYPEPEPPLTRLAIWAPRQGEVDLLIALHGNQPGVEDPTWFAWLRAQPSTDRLALFVPAVEDPALWRTPEALAALERQLDRLGEGIELRPERTWMAGFSGGCWYGFYAAAHLSNRISGFAAIGGGVPPDADLSALRGKRVLLACMERDEGAPCGGQDAGAAALAEAGASVERYTFPGLGHECPLEHVAPVLRAWIDS